MKFDILKTRKGKLKSSLEFYLKGRMVTNNEIDFILDVVDKYEKDNLATIEKLKRGKVVDSKRINGAIKNFLHAHPILTRELIGSLTKRILGALLSDKKEETLILKIKKWLRK